MPEIKIPAACIAADRPRAGNGSHNPGSRCPLKQDGLSKTHRHGITAEDFFLIGRQLMPVNRSPPILPPSATGCSQLLQSYGSCAVAFSGGLDSTVVAKAAQLALGDRAVAVTGVSASLAGGEMEECIALARQIGIRHEVIHTDELSIPGYQANSGNRCYFCKTELFVKVEQLAQRLGVAVVLRRHESRRPRRTSARACRPAASGRSAAPWPSAD